MTEAHEDIMKNLNAARKVIGWSNTGLPVAPTKADTTLKRLDRVIETDAMPLVRDLLRQIASGVLPGQHQCESGRREIEAMRDVMKETMANMQRQGETETDAPRSGS